MPLAQPPGCRSCRDGGQWTHAGNKDGQPRFIEDVHAELAHMADSDGRLLRAELFSKMKRAERGKLRFGADARTDDVDLLYRGHREILELRLHDVTAIDESGALVDRHTRLYFTERAAVTDELLSLALFTKSPGPVGLAEQNGHIDEASARLMRHVRAGR